MVIVILLIVILCFLGYASYSIKSQIYVKAVCAIPNSENAVFLTFDDSPHPIQTPKILDILKENNIKATFFCVGANIKNNESIVKRIVDEGHQIGNHSFSHSGRFPLLCKHNMITDILQCQMAIEKATGQKCVLFRPPFGVTNPTVAKAVKCLNLKVIGWSIRTYDTNKPTTKKLQRRIVRGLKPGAIVLLHDVLDNSDITLPMVIETIKSKGFTFAKIDN